jgi:peptidoglycan/xylan/chitin deacetylase (PgdA/CDA1 family)
MNNSVSNWYGLMGRKGCSSEENVAAIRARVGLLGVLPLGPLNRISRSNLLIPYYHMVSDEQVPHVRPIYLYRSVAQFTADLEFFLRHYQPIDIDELERVHKNGGTTSKRAFLLTFDDGFREMHDVVLPILREKGVPAVFFVPSSSVDNRVLTTSQKISLLVNECECRGEGFPSGPVGRKLRESGIRGEHVVSQLRSVRYGQQDLLDEIAELCDYDFEGFLSSQRPYLTTEQIKALLREGHSLGSHSIDHPLYAEIPFEEQIRQTAEGTRFLCERFGLKRIPFAFPHSDEGVSLRFFDKVRSTGHISITFGTSGLLTDNVPAHFQRFSMEKTSARAPLILARQVVRNLIRPAPPRPLTTT